MTVFPTKVLLATDGSEEAALAAQTASELAGKMACELHVVHVAIPSSHPVFYEGYYEGFDVQEHLQEEQQELDRRAQGRLDAQVRKIEAAGGSVVQAHLQIGRPHEEIVTLAGELGAGLIVMGSRGLGGIRRALLGSVSDSVVRHAHCPVLVARKEKPEVEEEVGPADVGFV